MAEEPAVEAAASPRSRPRPRPKLSVLPLIALIFFDVSGGPFGVEDSVRAGGGPLLPLLGFLLLPLLWSLPEALITAELASSLPSNGGYVLWISAAFGPFWGFQEGLWKWTSGTIDNALYPVLFLDYLRPPRPVRVPAIAAITAALTYLNYRGLHVVGLSAVLLAAFALSPFIAMSLLSIPRLQPRRWLAIDRRKIQWRAYFNSMFWNLNYWDKASTLAGEVDDPGRNFPRALFGALALVVASYLIPLLAGTGALDMERTEEWTDGYFAQVGAVIGGPWLGWWIQAAAAMSNMGLFEAEMSSDSFQLLGMAELGMLPAFFATRSWMGRICISAVKESLQNIYGQRFDHFVRNFEKSFGSTLQTLRLVNKAFVDEQASEIFMAQGDANCSSLSSINSEVVDNLRAFVSFSANEELQDNLGVNSLNNQLGCVSNGLASPRFNHYMLSTIEEQENANCSSVSSSYGEVIDDFRSPVSSCADALQENLQVNSFGVKIAIILRAGEDRDYEVHQVVYGLL